ncbi:MAG: exonuclease subunit SbcD [Saprospiraceae bacterium]|nr:exonuclease subunit SbcD [Saprospiraceae bacterium]
MKFIHTSDWHLGQRFLHNDRFEEHKMALQWLAETIQATKADALIVAGDVFDIGNPPNYARRLYYQFLTKLLGSTCRHVIIIGGNHDSPSTLEAPKDLLEALNIHVVGAAGSEIEDQIIELRSEAGNIEAVVAAVPFLRDKDLRYSVSGETAQARIDAIRKGIKEYYQNIGIALLPYQSLNIPILATGHLYLKGIRPDQERRNIYIGDFENIDASQFPTIFDYVALGHIHRAHSIGYAHYSGSLIPLSFSETADHKIVKFLDFQGKQPIITDIPVPLFRRLKSIEKPLETLKQRLLKLHEDYQHQLLPVWVDAVVVADTPIPDVDSELRAFAEPLHLELLKIRTSYNHYGSLAAEEVIDLKALNPATVFNQKCIKDGYHESDIQLLQATFLELQAWMDERVME